MSGIDFETYLNTVLASYFQNKAAKDYFKAAADTATTEFERTEEVRTEGMIFECNDDALDAHMQNTSALISPYENKTQERDYLKNRWDGLAKRIGSVELMLAELKRFGFPNARIYTWTDLILAGIPSAFGGGPSIAPGLDPNGGMYYIAKSPTVQVTVRQFNNGPNKPLGVGIGTTGSTANISIQLQTDNTGFPLSRPIDILQALDTAGAQEYMFYGFKGTGLGTATASPSLVLPLIFYSFFFIDCYSPNVGDAPIQWDDNTSNGTTTFVGPYNNTWKKLPAQPVTTSPTNNAIRSIWASAKNNVWAAPQEGTDLYRFDGTSWASYPVGLVGKPNFMFGTDANNIYLPVLQSVAGVGHIYKWDGVSWAQSFLPTSPTRTWTGIQAWGVDSSNMWVCGVESGVGPSVGRIFFWNGSSWVNQTLPTAVIMSGEPVYNIWGFSTNDVWAITNSYVMHFDGSSWSIVPGPTFTGGAVFFTLWGSSSNDLRIGARGATTGRISHFDGVSWTEETLPANGLYSIDTMAGSGPNDIWATSYGEDTLLHWDGTSWKSYRGAEPEARYTPGYWQLSSIPGSSDFYVGGDQGVSLYSRYLSVGTATVQPSGATGNVIAALHGLRKDYIWSAHDRGKVAFYDGSTWSVKNLPSSQYDINGIFAYDVNNVWFVGQDAAGVVGVCVKWNGTTFVDYSFASPNNVTFSDVWFASANEGYAVGNGGRLAEWNGTSWSISTLTFTTAPIHPNLYAISGVSRAVGKAYLAVGGQSGKFAFIDKQAATFLEISLPAKDILDLVTFRNEVTPLTGDSAPISYAYTVGVDNTVNIIRYENPTQVITNTSISLAASNAVLVKMQYFGPNDVWVIATDVTFTTSVIYRFINNQWFSQAMPATNQPYSIWGSSYNQIVVGTFNTGAAYWFYEPTTALIPVSVSGKLWDDEWTWDGTFADVNTLNNLRTLIRKYKPASMSCRFVGIQNKNVLTSYPVGEKYEEDYLENINGPYLFSYQTP